MASASARPVDAPPRAAIVVAAGSGVSSLREARRSLIEARQVAEAARRDPRDLPCYRLPHVGLAGLLHLLRDGAGQGVRTASRASRATCRDRHLSTESRSASRMRPIRASRS
ncbi:hypothetical protein F6X54_34225 [Micromonospora aurantiaca]|uniref:Uncharacterized protein n=1 Tax=Micromonospora aurantiaca (nom. illeg.) TaxID=47850 RepID=A0ABQ6U5M4_9ACTN|nr:hypothetical protein F6X54_34225 [Micromonospora aurantiaca]